VLVNASIEIADYRRIWPEPASSHFALGYMRGILSQLREHNDLATMAFANILLSHMLRGGISFVNEILSQVNGRGQ
jgi:hypothetical protein